MENIVFIHNGKSDYLSFAIQQAKLFNQDHTIWLISDTTPDDTLSDCVNFIHLDEFKSATQVLRSRYIHVARTPIEFELFCFQRWLILSEFVRSKNIKRFVYLDSDVLVFDDLANGFKLFSDADFTVSRGMAGSCSFWNNTNALDDFCKFFMGFYNGTNHSLIDKFIEELRESLKSEFTGWGMSDMYFLGSFKDTNKYRFAESTTIIENATYDNNINCWEETVPHYLRDPEKPLKLITWIDGIPYGTTADNNQLVRFRTLHMQGGAKFDLKEYMAASAYSASQYLGTHITHPNLCQQINQKFLG